MLEVVTYGLGPIGCRIAARLLGRPDLKVVAAIDIDPGKVGRDLGEVLGMSDRVGVRIQGSVGRLRPSNGNGVVVQATSSRLAEAARQIEPLVAAGWNVLSTCEELVNPRSVDEALAATLDAATRAAGVTVLGSGINPGFLLDSLVLVLSGVCARVDGVTVRRVVDTNQRRLPLQKKAGVGMGPEEFRRLAADRTVGHVGLAQSAYLLAERFNWPLADYQEDLEPVIAESDTVTGLGLVKAGMVIGQHQVARGRCGEREVIRYELDMFAGADPIDAITIAGMPTITQVLTGGVNGDIGTEAIIANLVVPVSAAPAGLLTMADLLPLRCTPGVASD